MKIPQFLFVILLLIVVSCGDDDDDDNNDQNLNQDDPIEASAEQIIVDKHNEFRSAVGVADIEWSDELAQSAQDWADQLAVNCDFEHSDSGFGENIWLGTTGFFTPNDVVNSWGEEIDFYDEDNNSCEGGECLHYTQIVWSGSTQVGCGTVTCDGFDIWVCQYNPAGNIIGQRPF